MEDQDLLSYLESAMLSQMEEEVIKLDSVDTRPKRMVLPAYVSMGRF